MAKKSTNLILILLVLLGVAVWNPILSIYYQQDEWQGLGHIFVEGITHPIAGMNFLQFIMGEGRSLARLFGLFLFGQFPFNPFPVAIFSLVFHLINMVLVYLLAQRLVKGTLPAVLAALFFLLNNVSSSAVTWFSTSVGTLPATTLILLAIFCFLRFAETKKRKFVLYVFFLLFASLFFKEIGIYLFIFLPLAHLLFEKVTVKKFFQTYWIFLFFFIVNAAFRIFELKSQDMPTALFLTGSAPGFWKILVARAALYPTTSFSLLFFPASMMIPFARGLTSIYYPFVNQSNFALFSETVVLDIVALFAFFAIIFGLALILKNSTKKEKGVVVFVWAFVFLSFLPYILIGKSFSYLESRYYYLPAAGGGILLAYLARRSLIIAILIILLISAHLKTLSVDLDKQVEISRQRENFMSDLLYFQPTLDSSKNIFFITGDSDYYIAGNKVPFQQGVGYTLATLYYKSGRIPDSFLTGHFLWDIGSEGYREENGFGFGLYQNKEALLDSIKTDKIPKEAIHAYYYDSSSKTLTDITNTLIK